ncbi:MAG: NusG domain II-containing protein [Firmicutes bacterium]|nr:NusG domain II-containing protein [Bacillota bacterium]MBR6584612.1 NusG domain II-containing protein [Bacillota bacterium]
MIKKADIVLFILIVVFGGLVSWWSVSGSITGEKVLITSDGKDYGIYTLAQDQVIDVTIDGHTNHITIKDGVVSMTYSTCKNQVCVNTGAISQTKDAIVCLPNKIVVEIVGSGKGGDADVISG